MLGEMIRSESISAEMASSLMNDVAYFYDIGSSLINAAESLLVSPDPDTTKSARSISLDDDQLSELTNQA